MGACTGTGKDGPDGVDLGFLKAHRIPVRRQWVASSGLPPRHNPDPAQPTQTPSGAGSGRSEPWRRTPSSIAHSAKTHPPQSLLSERRLDPAELTKNHAAHSNPERSGVGPERALEANPLIHRAQRENLSSPEPPQRTKARPRRAHKKLRSPPEPRAERGRAGASLGGEHPHPSRTARKPILPRASSANEGSTPRSYRESPFPLPTGAAG
jgi:hypothetical protein